MASSTGERSQGERSTRRRFIGVAVAGSAGALAGGPLLGGARAGTGPPECAPDPPGIATGAIAVAPGGRTAWTTDTHGTTITAHRLRDLERGRSIDVGGAPLCIAISPDGDLVLVTTAFYDRPGLALVDLRTGEVDRVDVGAEPGSVAFARDGRSAWVAGGGGKGTLTRVNTRTGGVGEPIALGAHPRGLALHPDGKRALVALNGAAEVAVLSLRGRRVTRRIATAPFPAQLAISADGARALVTHDGYGARAVTPIDVKRRRAGRRIRLGSDPAGVAFARSGSTAVVASANGTVALVNVRSRRRRTRKPGGAPRAVAVAGRRAIVADGRSGRLRVVRLGAAK